jgi:hypothetical protein
MMMLTTAFAMPAVHTMLTPKKVTTPKTDDSSIEQPMPQPAVREGVNLKPIGLASLATIMVAPFIHINPAIADELAQRSLANTFGCAGRTLGVGSNVGNTTTGFELLTFSTENDCKSALSNIKNVLTQGASPDNGSTIVVNVAANKSLPVRYQYNTYHAVYAFTNRNNGQTWVGR